MLEVFYTTKNDVNFEIYLREEERKKFSETLQRDQKEALSAFWNLSSEKSECWVLNDQDRIHGLIETSIGFKALDQMLREHFADALTSHKT